MLKTKMDSLDLKQADICRITGIQSSLMSDYMSGKKSPALTNAIRIADAMGMSLDELTGRPIKKKSASTDDSEKALVAAVRDALKRSPTPEDMEFIKSVFQYMKNSRK